MKVRISRSLFLGSVALLWSCTDPQGLSTDPASTVATNRPIAAAFELGATPLAVDDRGVPNLLRGGDAMPAMAAADAATMARMHVERLAPAWGVRPEAMPALESLGEVPVAGGTIVRLRQVIDGLPIEPTAGGELHVMVRGNGTLVGASGRLVARDTPHTATIAFVDDDAGAVARAVNDTYKFTSFAPAKLAMARLAPDGTRMLSGQSGPVNVSLSRARQAWIPDGKWLTPAWVVEAYSSDMTTTDGDAYRTVISASGRVISRTNLKADAAFKYRVFAETTGELHPFDGPIADLTPTPAPGTPNATPFPLFVAPNLVSVEGFNHPMTAAGTGASDPWLPATAVQTLGNNVDAYIDINAPDGLSFGDFRATATKAPTATVAGEFDRTVDFTFRAQASQTQQMAGVTSLFYLINWLHDFWYDAGFTEAAGNGQNVNFGRGGEDRDAVLAEAQDNANGGSRNNANMSTPSDGFPPRMQVFVWDNTDVRSLQITNSTPATRTPLTGRIRFGNPHFAVTGATVVLAADACTAGVLPDLTGKVVLVDRTTTCNVKAQAVNVQLAHGAVMLSANNAAGATPPTVNDDTTNTGAVDQIGVLSITQAEGTAIKTDLGAGAVTATLKRDNDPELEGTLDATVIAHEFAHYLHHRLTWCNTSLCGAQSEGWGDFDSLLVMARAGDDFNGAFPVGMFSTKSFANDPVYFGIRRAPYSANMDINPLSFRHMAAGVALPAGTVQHPFNAGNTANNSEVHNGGEVWTSMMWQGYSALQRQPGAVFADVRRKMQQYVVAGLLMAPPDATPTETRDAILLAAKASSPADADVLAAAYALRGFGSCAVSPPRGSSDFVGIMESTEQKGRIAIGELAMSRSTSCDSDEVLDGGETLQIVVPISNPGPMPMTGVTATISSKLTAIHIEKATVTVGTIKPDGQATATFSVALDDTLTAPAESDLSVEISSTDGCANVTVPIAGRLNSDDKPASSATDTFDAGATVWTATHVPRNTADTAELWTHARKTSLDGMFVGEDAGAPSDASLASPPLKAGTGGVTVSFSHTFQFEFAPAGPNPVLNPERPFDGGVIEVTTDAGATWQDVKSFGLDPYNKTLDGTPAATMNPLAGRRAFGDKNASNPAPDTVSLDFGTQLAGKTFQLRFRVGSDTNTGAPGWAIDNVAFTGIVGTPFPTLVADTGACAGVDHPKIVDNGGCCQAGGMAGANVAAALGVLALLVRRRRRSARAVE